MDERVQQIAIDSETQLREWVKDTLKLLARVTSILDKIQYDVAKVEAGLRLQRSWAGDSR
jgi:hypothetical protein